MKNKTSPGLYLLILAVWTITFGVPCALSVRSLLDAWRMSHFYGSVFALILASVGYFWLNGVKDIGYTLCWHLWLERRIQVPPRRMYRTWPHVALVYCTRNDFNAEALGASMYQDYPYYHVAILDDSDQPKYESEIDVFAARYGIEVVRRENRHGFKAGNLNNYLRHGGWDYAVILDSDEIIPENFIDRCLDYFADDPSVGIVQASHRATRNRTPFMRMLAPGVDAHWMTYQSVKDRFGFLSLLGHGAMISRACYLAAGGFPEIVAEDIGFTLRARLAGYRCRFAPDVICQEEFPIDYAAFRKRHAKWTEGNMEFIRNYTGSILRMPAPWYEKLDIILFTYSLPLSAVFFGFVLINSVILPALGYVIAYPLWMLIPTIAFLVAPMLNDIVTLLPRLGLKGLPAYLWHATVLFGSMYFTSLRASLRSLVGKSVFHVTPKTGSSPTLLNGLRMVAFDLVLAALLGFASVWAAGSIFPVLLLIGPTAFSIYMAVYNARSRPQPTVLCELHYERMPRIIITRQGIIRDTNRR